MSQDANVSTHIKHKTVCVRPFSKLALAAFLELVHWNDNRIVDETAKTEAVGTLEPSRQITKDHGCAHEWIVDIRSKLFANRDPNETQGTENQTNGPGKTLGLGGLPERFRVHGNCHQGTNNTKRRDWRQTNNERRQKLPGHKRKENQHNVGILPLPHIDDLNPGDNVEEAGACSNCVVVHIHLVRC